MTMNTNEEMSMLEVAEQLIQRKIKPQKFDKIAKEVCEIMGISDAEFEESVAQFYTDLTLSGKFVTVGEDKWDLKSRQKYEVANYDTYDIEFDDEVLEPIDEDDFAPIPNEEEAIVGKVSDSEDEDEEENEDDYSDESDAEVASKKENELEGLSIYHEDEME